MQQDAPAVAGIPNRADFRREELGHVASLSGFVWRGTPTEPYK